MRPMRPALALLAALLVPAVSFAGKGPPPPPDGPFFFVDQKSFDKLTSLANIDQAFDEFCLAGRAVFIDASTTLNHRVEIEFSSLGSIANQSPSGDRIDGLFTTVNLTLTVFDGPLNTANVIFDSTILGADCKLDGSLQQAGNKDRASLNCDVGVNLSDFGKVPEDVVNSVVFATAKKKTISVKPKKGTLRITHQGVTNPNSDTSTLVCPTSSDD
jgi:hypothetical protein